ncbi:N-acetylglucosamine kinase [Tenacibaculum sp. Bg11-29]|uniref:N-acetylglucosamine kinase n=1 Tax=Tenacibaculum sp. Bg11-29 TaxID=2058306 RepID=UPI000C331092|nr:N-acetylglucosamine kinase [Tenacibaculum sp. Bg11-29]PKH50446.1 N-acetylglucosamine kinase [Tenacibaculum sp. Bg11-29]
MILIADGGSTKVDWILLNANKEEIFRINSLGLNPAVLNESELQKRVDSISKLSKVKENVKKIYFYGAGCGTKKAVAVLYKVLQLNFTNAQIIISEDMLAAVYACTPKEPGIVCILGTGSNSCYYDGYKANKLAQSLGYTIMDEASGNYFGKLLLRDFYYKKMPESIAKSFEEEFNLNVDFVKTNLYLKANPNMYLASFAKFMFDYKNEKYINKLIKKGFRKYFKYQVLPYNKGKETSIYFIGSIAYYFRDILKKVALKNNLVITDVIQRPIDNLVRFHQNNNF